MIRQRLFIVTKPSYFILSYFFFMFKITRFLFFIPLTNISRKFFWFKRVVLQFRNIIVFTYSLKKTSSFVKKLYYLFFLYLSNLTYILPLSYYAKQNLFFRYLISVVLLSTTLLNSYYVVNRFSRLTRSSVRITPGNMFFSPQLSVILTSRVDVFWIPYVYYYCTTPETLHNWGALNQLLWLLIISAEINYYSLIILGSLTFTLIIIELL